MPGVIYYHFADLDDLFVATAHFTSRARLARYRSELDGVTSAVELVRRLRALYAEDAAHGHVAAVGELVAAAVGAYLGLEMMSHLDAEQARPEAMFDAAEPAAAMFDALRPDPVRPDPAGGGSPRPAR